MENITAFFVLFCCLATLFIGDAVLFADDLIRKHIPAYSKRSIQFAWNLRLRFRPITRWLPNLR